MQVDQTLSPDSFQYDFHPLNLFSGASLPPAPSGVMVNHPLLVRSQESIHRDAAGSQGGNNAGSSSIGGSRLHRTSRSRNTFRYNPNTQTLHVQYTRSRHVNPPAILQRYF